MGLLKQLLTTNPPTSAGIVVDVYRKSHDYLGSTVGAQTNYPMKINVYKGAGSDGDNEVYLGANVRDDFGDVRFTKDDGVTLLDYWMAEKVDGDYAVFWVEVGNIPASPGTATIYIYYGNPDATTTSDGDATFTFFDDFTRDRGWTIGNGTYIQIIDDEDCLWIDYRRPAPNLYCYRPVSGLTDGFELWIDSLYDITLGPDDWVHGWFHLSKDNDGSRHTETEIYGIGVYGQAFAAKHRLAWWNGSTLSASGDGDADPDSSRFIYRIRKYGTYLGYYCSSGNVADSAAVVSAGIPAIAYMKAWISDSMSGTVDDDARRKIYLIRIKKWVNPEPTDEEWGPEEPATMVF